MRFTVLGPVRAWRDGAELALGPPKQRALLALLLVRLGAPVSLSDMVDVLWPQGPPRSAPNVVRHHVGSLRRLLGPDGGARAAGPVVRGSGGYRLDVHADDVDLLAFRQLAERARQAARDGSPRTATDLYAEALELWRGPVAHGIPPDVRAHPAFGAVDEECLDAVRGAAVEALAAGVPERALAPLRQATAAHPLDEPLQAHLVLALAGAGRRAEALAAYHTVRVRLAEELGVAPGRELVAAHQRVLEGHTAAVRPPAVSSGPESDDAPLGRLRPRAGPLVRPAQLPGDLPVFAGRGTELAYVDALLPKPRAADSTPPATVVITIEGMAGVGKTSLAVHWAHRVAHRFPDGQLYADLRGFDPLSVAVDPQDTLRAFLFALGVHPQDMPVGADAQSSLYRSLLSGRRVLVLLDNARDSAQVRPLLPGAPGCLVLVTSRTRLQGLVAAVGAHSFTLRPLHDAGAREVLTRRLGARRMAAEAAAVEAVIALCGRLPLALAILAARAAEPGIPLSSIAAELRAGHGSLDALSGDEADARAVFSWSYRALSPEAARLFRLLALHPGPDVSQHAAASLAGLGLREARTTLASLARSHLLTEPVPGRYTCHDLLRAYAGERLRTEETEAGRHGALGRLLDHALGTVRAAVDLLLPHRSARETPPPPRLGTAVEPLSGREAAATWLSTEIPGLIALVESAAQGGFPVHAWQLALAVELPLDRRGRREEQIAVQRTALAAAEQHGDPLGLPHIHRTLGFALHRVGANEEALAHLDRALDLFTSLDHPDGQARTLRSLAFLANSRARHQDALDHYGRALALHRAADNPRGRATVLNEIGWTHILRGEHHEALTQCATAVALHQETGDANGEAAAWDSLGYAHHHLEQYTHALSCYRHALAVYREVGDRTLEAETLSHIGDTQHALGNRPSALASWGRAAAILSELGHPDSWQLLDKLHGTAADPP
ncbi:AfsR/SARP family transcriptional regulator [Streptomyces spectabilis]|uniref:AfsR family transcriptional regulator n=1 Tax=Streptomyces spectabilis TaxID=68270 RepID=A0A5P2WXB5_STRST|nr:BTAD domain-containing putative transcriptional regulator [Streptomyces spectabilis]MBB5107943.1 DNA-binding SARP family transcriptional activator [Streptomyces spectabilis]MCI3899727.1 tetratricopeptide repeat protein [Streptomyces spectabilis]QEV57403.1 AfsR family transcriptional regulator [Streptomyces spectabilis]GGV52168.1 SARP family transcriptional regulator [Streptomyces spectabilis]